MGGIPSLTFSAPPFLSREISLMLLLVSRSPHVVRPISTPVPETAGAEETSKHQQPSLNTSQSPVLSGQQRPEPSSVDSTAPALQLANTEPKRVMGWAEVWGAFISLF